MYFADRVLETTSTAGTADFVLNGGVVGYQDFATAFADGDTVRYAVSLTGGDWEVGEGVYTLGTNSIARTTIFSSSNGGAIVTFPAGVKDIWCDIPAATLAQVPGLATGTVLAKDANGNVTGGTDVLVGNGFMSISVAGAPVAATGLIRMPEEPGVIISGLSAGADYSGVAYSAASAAWTFGNSAQYSYVYSYAAQILGIGGGVSFYDGRNGLTTDSAVVIQYLLADKTTTLTAGVATNFTFAVNPGEIWAIALDGNVGCSGVGGVGFGLDCPAGSVLTNSGSVFGAGANAATLTTDAMININTVYGGLSSVASASALTPRWAAMRATVVVGANGGNITLRLYSRTAGQTSRLFARAKFEARRAVGV